MRTPIGAAYTQLYTYSNQFTDAFSFTANTAALAKAKKFSAGLFSERRFILQELSTYSLAAALPTSSGNFGFKGDYFGGSVYNETTLGLAYARKLGTKVDVGVQFNYSSLKTATYGFASTITFDAGAIFHLTEALQSGFHIYNPTGMKLGKGDEEKLPSIYSAGLGYDVSPNFFIGAEIQKVEDQALSINAGFHYLFAEGLSARAGINSATSVYYIGFGVHLRPVWLHITASFHPYLGVTPGLLLIYAPKE